MNQTSAPPYPLQHKGPALVVGSAACFHDDLARAKVIFGDVPVIAVNGAARVYLLGYDEADFSRRRIMVQGDTAQDVLRLKGLVDELQARADATIDDVELRKLNDDGTVSENLLTDDNDLAEWSADAQEGD